MSSPNAETTKTVASSAAQSGLYATEYAALLSVDARKLTTCYGLGGKSKRLKV